MFRPIGVRLVLTLFLLAPAASAADLQIQDSQIQDFTEPFTRAFEESVGKSDAERLEAFKRHVAPLFPAFYGIERFAGRVTAEARDKQILQAFTRFPEIREDYTRKATQFRENLSRDMTSFRGTFPDFALERPIFLLHSLGEMDGGTRDLDGAPQLIFGADAMAMYHQGWRSESAFFHHELFHIYHRPRFGDCDQVWCMLWIEGLAVHVAAAMNADATDAELLLDFPPGMSAAVRAVLPAAFAHAYDMRDSKDMDVLRALFSSGKDETGLPPRRGYVLGHLVAREVARTHTLANLANLPRDQVRAAVEQALVALGRQ